MKEKTEKYLPLLMIILGGARLLYERYPLRLAFLRILGGKTFGWIFWLCGISGAVWFLLRTLGSSESEVNRKQRKADSVFRQFFINYGPELLILLLTAASLSMLFRSGYYWDDAVNSTLYLSQKKDSVSTFRHVLDFMGDYLRLGRINVLSIYYYFFFYIENVSVYKALIILSILADQLILRKVLLEFGVRLSAARLGMALVPLMLQTRVYQDPVSGFYSLMQVLTAEMLLCALFLHRWLHTGKKRQLFLSLLFFGIGLMTYEVCFPFLVMVCLLILVNRKNFIRAVKDSLPFVFLTALMLACVWFVRSGFVMQKTYAGVAFSLNPERIFRAFLTQLSAGLPLSFYSAGYQASVLGNAYPAATFMHYDFLSFLKAIRFSDVLIVLGFIFILAKINLSKTAFDGKKWSLLVLGLSFAVLPVITVAVSERYQGQLMPGLGYLPVYMQYYGVVILLIWITESLRYSECIRAVCLSAFVLVLLLNLQNNRAVTDIMNRSFYEPRNAGEAALRGGILDFMPQDAVLISVNDRRYLWEADWNNYGLYKEFYGNYSKTKPRTISDNRLLKEIVQKKINDGSVSGKDGSVILTPENIWVIDYYGGKDRGLARLGRVRYALADPETLQLRDIETDFVLYFFSGDYAEKMNVQYSAVDGSFVEKDPSSQFRVRQSGSGILYQLPEEEQIIFRSLTFSQ